MVTDGLVRHTACEADWQVITVSRYALPLRGYDAASVWGYDAQTASYFAYLWRNPGDSDDPDFSVSGLPVDSPLTLAQEISARTGAPAAEVVRAMAFATTAPEAPSLAELADVLACPA